MKNYIFIMLLNIFRAFFSLLQNFFHHRRMMEAQHVIDEMPATMFLQWIHFKGRPLAVKHVGMIWTHESVYTSFTSLYSFLSLSSNFFKSLCFGTPLHSKYFTNILWTGVCEMLLNICTCIRVVLRDATGVQVYHIRISNDSQIIDWRFYVLHMFC